MVPSPSLRGLMVLICPLAVLSLAQALDTLYVKPNSNTTCDKDPCLTLMEYVDRVKQAFTRNTELVFLPGQHLLGTSAFASDIAIFIMRNEINTSQSHPEIVCTAAVGLGFISVSYVSVTELSFVSCGDIITNAPWTWVFTSYNVDLFVMANTTVRMAHGSAIFAVSSTFYSLGNHFQDNSVGQGRGGGGIQAFISHVSIENSQFYNNSGFQGGAVYINGSLAVFSGVNTFADNKAVHGGGIFLHDSNVSFEESNTFLYNSVIKEGGAIASQFSVTKFSGNSTFVKNSANALYRTAAVYFIDVTVSFNGNTTFIGNGPSWDILKFINCTAAIEGTLNFEYNQGGLTAITNSNITILGIVNFISNSGTSNQHIMTVLNGSRVTICGTTVFAGNSAVVDNDAGIVHVELSTIRFMGHTTFKGNLADAGAAITALQSSVEFNGTQTFENNVASEWGGAILIVNSMVNVTGCSSFINNSAGTDGGAISSANGQLYITGNATFIGNKGSLGGGLSFGFNSQMFLVSPLQLSFQHNSADKGGAIYVSDASNTLFCSNYQFSAIGNCFIRIKSLSNDVQLDFDGNTASEGGENIFGGMLDKCSVIDNLLFPERGLSLLVEKINISTISSEPLHLCFCVNGQVNCFYDPPPFNTVRGATISVPVVAVDQVNHTVAATVRSYFHYNIDGSLSDFSLGQGIQQIGATCTSLNYTVLTTASYSVIIASYPEGPCRDVGNSQLQISVHLLPYPVGFELSGQQCICEMRLQPFTNSCSAENQRQTFTRNTNFWVDTDYRDNNYIGLILHPHCPLDYSISNYPTDISVNDLDSQCSFNRSGILCGSCQQNLSLALGSSQYLPCSNSYLALLIPFAVAGVALVFILFMLRLTLSTGTLSGLILYANVVAVNKEVFFPPRTTNNYIESVNCLAESGSWY